jgi:mono/diheme cytochrome c family protein
VSKVRGVRFMLAAGLVAGAVGLSACGDDDEDEASEAASSIESQAAEAQSSAEEQVDSAVSQAGDVQSSVESQIDSAMSEADTAVSEATSEAGSVASEATAEAESVASEATAEDTAAAGGGDPAAGKEVFMSAGCVGCHTLADAGATGAVGPNLDDVKPSFDTVVQFVTNGSGPMPSFKGQLSDTDIQNVAAYVSSVAGQ